MDAVKTIGGALSAAGGAFEGAFVGLLWHAVNVSANISRKSMQPDFFMLPPVRSNFQISDRAFFRNARSSLEIQSE